jgi:hypothetical protein
MINDISVKSVTHFLSHAQPNPGLYVDEFIVFVTCFPVIDLTWRTGELTPEQRVFVTFYGRSRRGVPKGSKRLMAMMTDAGFSSFHQGLTPKIMEERLYDYAAAYRVDREEEHWTYPLTCRQLAAHCLTPRAVSDTDSFIGLMEDVVDRMRGRVKREFARSYSNVTWMNPVLGRRRDHASQVGTSATIYTWPGRDDR